MCTPAKCCCCCGLRTGVFFINVWNLVLANFSFTRSLIRDIIREIIYYSDYAVDQAQLVLTVFIISSTLAIVAVLLEKRTLLIPAIVCDIVRFIPPLVLSYREVFVFHFYDDLACGIWLVLFVLGLYISFVLIQVSYYVDLKRRQDGVTLGVAQGPAFSSLPPYSVEQHPAQIPLPNLQMPPPYPQTMPTPVFGYAVQSRTNATAPPLPYRPPPPYVPVQNTSTNEKPIV